MKNVILPLAKIVLLPLRLTEAASAPGIHKNILGSEAPTSIISNDETEEIMKIVKPLEGFGLLLKGVSETIQNKSEISKRKISWNVIRCIRCKVITKNVTR